MRNRRQPAQQQGDFSTQSNFDTLYPIEHKHAQFLVEHIQFDDMPELRPSPEIIMYNRLRLDWRLGW